MRIVPDKRQWRTMVLVGGLGLVMWLACGRSEPIPIGFVAGTSGRVADLGISGRDAVQLAVEQCNRSGGIHGRPVQLLIQDDCQDPQTARQVVQELIDAGVVAIVGPMTSDMGVAVVPLLNEARIPNVSPTVTTQQLSGKDDYFFRVSATTKVYATLSANYHFRKAGMRRVAAAYDLGNRTFCENWLDNFAQTFSANGGAVIAAIGFAGDSGRTFTDLTGELLATGPDGILIVANSMDSALICQQVRKRDQTIRLTLADWGATERLLELGGHAVEGVTVIQTFDRDCPAPSYQAFRSAYQARFKREPGFPGVYAYDAIQVLLTALSAHKPGDDLKSTILAIRQFQGLQGDITFDDYGDVMRPNASISVVRDNTFVVLE